MRQHRLFLWVVKMLDVHSMKGAVCHGVRDVASAKIRSIYHDLYRVYDIGIDIECGYEPYRYQMAFAIHYAMVWDICDVVE